MISYKGHPLQAAIDVCPTEEKANLVAAAPRLLEAAKATVAWHNTATHGWYLHDLESTEKQDFRKMISALIAAIAQAEGKEGAQ